MKVKQAAAKRARGGKEEPSESDSEDLEMVARRTAPKGVSYVPATFETMMESFGINLQRKTLQDRFKK